MKLFLTHTSPYARKVRILVSEHQFEGLVQAEHWSHLELVRTPADLGRCGPFRCASGAQNRKVVPLRFSRKRPHRPSLTGGLAVMPCR